MFKPSGPYRLATELRSHGYKTLCINLKVFDGFDENLKLLIENVVSEETLWVGFSTTFTAYPVVNKDKKNQILDLINFIKTLNPKTEIIAGGTRADYLSKYNIKIFKGYCDKEIIEFTEWCQKINKNLMFRSNIINGTEYLNFHNSQISYIKEDVVNSNEVLPIEIARGCIFKCKFCAFQLNGKKKGDWIKKAEVLKEELQRNYDNWGVTNYMFCDDTYNDSLDKIKVLQEHVYSKLPFKINFSAYLRLDLIMRFPEMAEVLKENGLESAVFGIETVRHRNAKLIGKGIDPLKQFDFIRELKQTHFKDIQCNSGFIFGLPYDTHESIQEDIEFLASDKNPLDSLTINTLRITPKDLGPKSYWYSDIDVNYEKYGYEVWLEGETVKWKNEKNGITFEDCLKYEKESTYKFDQIYNVKGMMVGYVKSLGVPLEEIKKLPLEEIRKKYNLMDRMLNQQENYKNQLFDVLKISKK
jgi:radical SAM superfamily enzyme YgiQ (UPF0313 family)